MSLRYGLLGLLAEGPASGYDLARRFQEVLGPVWPAQHPKIYAELNRLAAEGLIEVDSIGARRRKAYRLTDAGLTAVRGWIATGEVDHTLRLEPLLRSYFFWLMDPDDLRRHLEREAEFYAAHAARFRDFADRSDQGELGERDAANKSPSFRITIEAGIRLYEALAEWARWAGEQADQDHGQVGRADPGVTRRTGG